ncbi:MAG: hypothetical protein R3234_08060 [Thermoanaerobaculia bacterium]|nr:hypothetical protein [Thermoanaerobaculia bacterium]
MPERQAHFRPFSISILGALVLLAGLVPARAGAQEEPGEETAPPLALEKISVTPETPGPGTLVQLRTEVANRGEKIASQLGFRVSINGEPLPVYRNQLFMQALPPGETSEVRLYNFWTTETFRPLPEDGKLRLEVSLEEAHWYRIEDVEEEGETIEEWTPLEPVPALPSRRSIVLDLNEGEPGPYADLESGPPGKQKTGNESSEEPDSGPDGDRDGAGGESPDDESPEDGDDTRDRSRG